MATKLKKVFGPGEARTLSLRITNRAKDRQPVRFELRDVPEDWDVFLDRDELLLDGGGDGVVKVSIRAPVSDEKQKVGMRLLTVPELEPDKDSEIVILAKLKPGRDGAGKAKAKPKAEAKTVEESEEKEGGGPLSGLLSRGKEEGPPRSVIRARGPRRGPPEPTEVLDFQYAPAVTSGGIYHVSHIPVDGEGTVLRFREQVQLVCSLCASRDVCFDGKFHKHMDRETFLESDHCWLMAGDYGTEGVEPVTAE